MNINRISKDDNVSFHEAYIERCNKETEEMIALESAQFLDEKISYLKRYMNEFIYIESDWFELLGANSVCLEVDDVFRTYDVMLGLKLQKKYEGQIKTKLNELLKEELKYSLLFNQADGLWELNFALNGVEGFQENISIGDACGLVYRLLFELVEAVGKNKTPLS